MSERVRRSHLIDAFHAGALVAEYRYSGLGHRIAVLADTDLDSDVDGSDVWYDSSFDESWRMVATYKSNDANPKERFVHHQAGAGGDGGRWYIVLVAFREKDTDGTWTNASDGSCEERRYYCENQHADVVALVTDAGAQREMARHSACGVPIGLPVGDTNSDGDCDQAHQNRIRDWALATSAVYDVRGDLDLDRDVDLTDRGTLRDNYKGTMRGRTKLSAVGNARGCSGYLAAGFDSTVYVIRHRVFPSALGVWASRDPLGYRAAVNLVAWGGQNALALVDPYGLDYLDINYARFCGFSSRADSYAQCGRSPAGGWPIDALDSCGCCHDGDNASAADALTTWMPWARELYRCAKAAGGPASTCVMVYAATVGLCPLADGAVSAIGTPTLGVQCGLWKLFGTAPAVPPVFSSPPQSSSIGALAGSEYPGANPNARCPRDPAGALPVQPAPGGPGPGSPSTPAPGGPAPGAPGGGLAGLDPERQRRAPAGVVATLARVLASGPDHGYHPAELVVEVVDAS